MAVTVANQYRKGKRQTRLEVTPFPSFGNVPRQRPGCRCRRCRRCGADIYWAGSYWASDVGHCPGGQATTLNETVDILDSSHIPDDTTQKNHGSSANRAVPCGQVWLNGCPALVEPSSWSHGEHPQPPMQWAAASHHGTPPEVLRQLAQDDNEVIRQETAMNPGCPPDALLQLARDPEGGVRGKAANHPYTPLAGLQLLLSDPIPAVADIAARNPNLPRATLAMWQLARR